MKRGFALCVLVAGLLGWRNALGVPITFTLLTHGDNATLLPQPRGVPGVSGDHLIRTSDDITNMAYNPHGCFTFGFTNPFGVLPPDYPPGYAEGIHAMEGTLDLDIGLLGGERCR